MPKKVRGPRQIKVISAVVSAETYSALENLAKELYLEKKLSNPNMAQLLKYIVNKVLSNRTIGIEKMGSNKDETGQNVSSNPNMDLESRLEPQSSVDSIDPSRQSKPQQYKSFEELEKGILDI